VSHTCTRLLNTHRRGDGCLESTITLGLKWLLRPSVMERQSLRLWTQENESINRTWVHNVSHLTTEGVHKPPAGKTRTLTNSHTHTQRDTKHESIKLTTWELWVLVVHLVESHCWLLPARMPWHNPTPARHTATTNALCKQSTLTTCLGNRHHTHTLITAWIRLLLEYVNQLHDLL